MKIESIDAVCNPISDNEDDDDGTTTTSSFEDEIESTYAYEEFDDDDLHELLERAGPFTTSDESESSDDDDHDDGGDEDLVMDHSKRLQQHGPSGDTSTDASLSYAPVNPYGGVKVLKATLVQIRIRPQYVEYLRARRGWSALTKFKPKYPQQYTQHLRCVKPTYPPAEFNQIQHPPLYFSYPSQL